MTGTSGSNAQQAQPEEQAKDPERDESILRTLLLENGDVVPCTSQDQPFQEFQGNSTENYEGKMAAIPSLLSSALAAYSPAKRQVPSATVTSGESYSSSCGENLPTVATMVANATDNYGVDLRTVTNRNSASASNNILQEALSSNDPIYRPVAIRSPNQRPDIRVVENSPLVARERSGQSVAVHESPYPILSELSRRSPHLSRRLIGRNGDTTSHSSSSVQRELLPVAHSPFKPPTRESASSSHISKSPKSTSKSSRKSHTFSMWGGKSASIAPQTNGHTPSSTEQSPPQRSATAETITDWQRWASFNGSTEHRQTASNRTITHNQRWPSVDLPNPSHPPSINTSTNHQRWTSVNPAGNRSSSVESKSQNNNSTSIDLRGNNQPSTTLDLKTYQQRWASISARPIALPSNGSVNPRAHPFLTHHPAATHSNNSLSTDLRNRLVSSNSQTSRSSRVSPNGPAPLDQRTHALQNPMGLTNGHSSFMIVPPATTLQTALERDPRFVPLAGPLMPIAPSEFPKCSGCGISRGRYLCSGCERQLYCSAKCQSLRWPEHSKTCSSTPRKDNP